MVTAAQIRRKVKSKRIRYQETNTPTPPMTGAEAIAYWKREGVRGVFSNTERYPQDSPELARLFRKQAETRG